MPKGRIATIFLIALAALLACVGRASAQTWNGLGANDNWQTTANWTSGVAPVNNGTANVFFGGTTRLTPNVDVVYSINSLTFNSTLGANLFTVSGSAITIGAGGITNNDADLQTINSSINLSAPQTWNATSGPLSFGSAMGLNGNLLIFNTAVGNSIDSGSIAGAGGFTKAGIGTLTLSGGGSNTMNGLTTVNAGTLIFAKSPGLRAISGTLTIGDGSGVDTVQYQASNQTVGALTTINSSGVLDLNGFADNLSNLIINGGSVTIGTGTLTVFSGGSPQVTMTGGSISSTGAGKLSLQALLQTNPSATTATISGTIDMNSAGRTFTIADGTPATDLDISAAIPNGGITKNGTGTLRLSGSADNGMGLQTTVNSGTLELAKSLAATAISGTLSIGDGIGGVNADVVRYIGTQQVQSGNLIVVNSSGLLDLNGQAQDVPQLTLNGGNVTTGTGTLTLNGFGLVSGQVTQTATIAGHLDLAGAARTFTINDSTVAVDVDISAGISSTAAPDLGSVTKLGTGTLRFSGATANTYTGATTVNGGTLILAKTALNGAIVGNLVIGDANGLDTVRLEASEQIADSASITLRSTGLLELNGFSETVGPITFEGGGTIDTSTNVLIATGDLASVAAGGGAGAIVGNMLVLQGGRVINVQDGAVSPDLIISANVSGGPLIKNGPGELYLSGNNTINSAVLNDGVLLIASNSALGSGSVQLNGGVIRAADASRTLSNPISITGPTTVTGAFDLILNGGVSGSGDLTKTGTGSLSMAAGSSIGGAWTLAGGTLASLNLQIAAHGSLTMNAGTFAGSLNNSGTFTYNNGSFNGSLINHGAVVINNTFLSVAQGITNFADMTLDNGLFLTTAGLTNNGQININGATIDLSNSSSNNGSITGFGAIGGASQFFNNGIITQAGGNLTLNANSGQTNSGNIDLDAGRQLIIQNSPLNNLGTINLNGAIVPLGAPLNNFPTGTIAGHGTIQTGFSNNGLLLVQSGTTNISNAFASVGTIQIAGVGSSLIGGKISNFGTIQGAGAIGSDVDNNGTIEAIGGTLIFSGAVNNSGTIAASNTNKVLISSGLASNTGIINLTGGTFDNNGFPLTSAGQISGYGTFRAGTFTNNGSMTFSGGTSTINGNVTNSSGHQIRVAYTPAIFTGNVTNNGIFKSTSTTVTFAGTYTENGTFISDPADNYFNSVNIGPAGAWIGGVGDRFFVAGDFLNQSTNTTQWDTVTAELHLITSGAGDLFQVAGTDLGVTFAGYDDNFAWGTLALAPGRSLTLIDADAIPGGAVYVNHLDLPAGLAQISTISSNGLNIYYDLGNPENAYLSGMTYSLAGGGTISPVPEPASAAISILASALLLAKRRRGNHHPFGDA